MSQNNTKETKPNGIVIAVILIIIVAVVGYAVVKELGNHNSSTGDSSLPSASAQPISNSTETTSTTPQTEESWKEAYTNYIKKAVRKDYVQFKLVYVDDNDVPELYMYGMDDNITDRICTYVDGDIVEFGAVMMRKGFYYIERSGKIRWFNGKYNLYSEEIIELKDGRFAVMYDGSYALIDGDESSHSLNKIQVNRKKYHNAMDSYYDTDQEKPMHIGTVGFMEMLKELA